jgi:hypothetical protein
MCSSVTHCSWPQLHRVTTRLWLRHISVRKTPAEQQNIHLAGFLCSNEFSIWNAVLNKKQDDGYVQKLNNCANESG